MTSINVNAKAKKVSISARVFRVKENRWIDLGVIARSKGSRNIVQRLRRLLWQQY